MRKQHLICSFNKKNISILQIPQQQKIMLSRLFLKLLKWSIKPFQSLKNQRNIAILKQTFSSLKNQLKTKYKACTMR